MSPTTALLKRLRATGMTQSEISRLTGIPQPRVSRWEQGGVPSPVDDALKLAALGRARGIELVPEPSDPNDAACPRGGLNTSGS